jgi:hypothetical protein
MIAVLVVAAAIAILLGMLLLVSAGWAYCEHLHRDRERDAWVNALATSREIQQVAAQAKQAMYEEARRHSLPPLPPRL